MIDSFISSNLSKYLIKHGYWLKYIPVLAVFAFFASAVAGDSGLAKLYQLYGEQHKIEEKIKQQKDSNAKLRREVEALRTDPKYLEKLAREDLGLVMPGEVVYQFSNELILPSNSKKKDAVVSTIASKRLETTLDSSDKKIDTFFKENKREGFPKEATTKQVRIKE